jgi:hypothetical protein
VIGRGRATSPFLIERYKHLKELSFCIEMETSKIDPKDQSAIMLNGYLRLIDP